MNAAEESPLEQVVRGSLALLDIRVGRSSSRSPFDN